MFTAVLHRNLNCFKNLLVICPFGIQLFGEVAFGALNGSDKSVGVKAELDVKFLIEIDKLFSLRRFLTLNSLAHDRILSPHFVYECHLAIGQLNLLAMGLKVLSDSLLDVGLVKYLLVDDVADILEHEVKLTDRGTLNEVLNNLALDTAHL